MGAEKSEVLQGTPDLAILKTPHGLGPQHGFGPVRRIEPISEEVLTLNEGTVYTSLLRLREQGWNAFEPGASVNSRDSISRRGEKKLAVEAENWQRASGYIERVLSLAGEK